MRVFVLCVVLALGVLGCQQAQETVTEQAETMMEEAETMVDEAVEEVMDDVALVDPVCGMEVTMESEWTAEYEGVTFYFCCEDCRDKFVGEPGKYLEAMGEEVLPAWSEHKLRCTSRRATSTRGGPLFFVTNVPTLLRRQSARQRMLPNAC